MPEPVGMSCGTNPLKQQALGKTEVKVRPRQPGKSLTLPLPF
ncbi:hypothetical protein ACHMXK_08975 [Polaromonas sp. UC242_47]